MAGTQAATGVFDFKFDVPNISELKTFWSTKFYVYGVPWKVKVSKEDGPGGVPRLIARLFCAKKNKSTQWTYAASITSKVLSFDEHVNAKEFQGRPQIYNDEKSGYGPWMLRWDELFNAKKQYVKDDTVKLVISIKMADPKEQNKCELLLVESKLVVEEIDKSFVGCSKKIQLTVTNIGSLFAIRSAPFVLRNEPWRLTVLRDPLNELGVRLSCMTTSETFSCGIELSAKLVSMKSAVESIKEAQNNSIKRYSSLVTNGLVSWTELHNPNNGFVNNNSIVIEVEIKSDMLEQHYLIVKQRQGPIPSVIKIKRYKMACTMCSKLLQDQRITFAECDHLFCSDCTVTSIGKPCPLCKSRVYVTEVKHVRFLN